jgi:FkbM family methyltransferase
MRGKGMPHDRSCAQMSWKSAVRELVRRAGYDVLLYDLNHPLRRRMRLMADRRISLLLDVGASSGQYGREMRTQGYSGRIVSFEPLQDAFRALLSRARGDAAWRCEQIALGDAPATATIHVAGNSWSSSLLPMLDAHSQAAPESRYVGSETIRVRTLDEVLPEIAPIEERIFLKIDTQGYEKRVLQGAAESLRRIELVQLECSLRHLYQGDDLACDLIAWMAERSFSPVSIEPGFVDPQTGHQLQADIIFARS